jgi:4a-hydroxytetrahydrobiopterin dehydratase
MGLEEKKCVPCREGAEPLKGSKLEHYSKLLSPGWTVESEHHLQKEYKFKDFKQALAFVNKVGDLAEKEGHHPDITLSWGKVILVFFTHKIHGLTESDFIMAAKCDLL